MSTAVATGMAPAHGGFRRPGKGKADPDERKRDTNGLFSSDEEEGDEAVRREEEEEEDAAAAAAGGLSDSSSIGAASSDSSSIGDNSASEEEEDGEEDDDEVQSKASEAAGLGMMGLESLEDALPSKRGLSNFYAGKSKSFTSLAEAAAKAAATEIAKPENPFNKRRRVLAAWSRRRASCSALATAYLPALLAPDHAVLEEDDEEGADDDSDDDDGQCGGGKGRRERRGPPSFPPPRLISQMTRNTNAGSFRSPRSFSMTDLQSASCNLAEN